MLKVTLPDGKTVEYRHRVRPVDIAAEIGPRLAKATLAATVDGKLVGAGEYLPEEANVSLRLLTSKDAEALGILRHSCAHVMARAVMRLYEGVQLAFGPTVAEGFYYDFGMEHALSEDDFPKIEAEMARIVKEDEPFERVEMSHEAAVDLCRDLHQSLKVEHLGDMLADEPTVSFYRQGEFVDLCRGPHVPSAGAHRGLQVALGGGGLLEGRRLAPAASAALRHRLFHQARPRRAPAAARGSQAPRPSRAGQTTRTVLHRAGGRSGAGLLAAQGRGGPPRTGKLPLRRTDPPRLSAGQYAGDRQRAPVRDLGSLSLLQGLAVPADRNGRRRARTCCGR